MHDLGGMQPQWEWESERAAHEPGQGGPFAAATGEFELPLNETQELELTSELLEVSGEQELEQFLGNVSRAAGSVVGRFAEPDAGRALRDILKDTARRALPLEGGARGGAIAPGPDGAMGSGLAQQAGTLLGLELEGLSPQEQEFEAARQFTRLAGGAYRRAALAPRGRSPQATARRAVIASARRYAPGLVGLFAPRPRARYGYYARPRYRDTPPRYSRARPPYPRRRRYYPRAYPYPPAYTEPPSYGPPSYEPPPYEPPPYEPPPYEPPSPEPPVPDPTRTEPPPPQPPAVPVPGADGGPEAGPEPPGGGEEPSPPPAVATEPSASQMQIPAAEKEVTVPQYEFEMEAFEFEPSREAEFGELGQQQEAGLGELGYEQEAGFRELEYEEEAGLGELGYEQEAGFGEMEYEEEAESGQLGQELEMESESPLYEVEEMELAGELLEVSNEEELEQFLGKLIRNVGRAAGGFIRSPVGQSLGGILKNLVKQALPAVGGALGTMVAPGVGTAFGSKLGAMAGDMFEMELEGMAGEQAEFEVARRYVQLASTAAQNAALAPPNVPPRQVANQAVAAAARRYAPGLLRMAAVDGRPAAAYGGPPPYRYRQPRSGRWIRRGRRIVLYGV